MFVFQTSLHAKRRLSQSWNSWAVKKGGNGSTSNLYIIFTMSNEISYNCMSGHLYETATCCFTNSKQHFLDSFDFQACFLFDSHCKYIMATMASSAGRTMGCIVTRRNKIQTCRKHRKHIQLQLCMCMLSVGREEVNTEIRVVKLLKMQCMVKLQVIK